jgi:hypothetical protein
MAFRVRHNLATVAGHGALQYRVESVSRSAENRVDVHTCSTDSLVVFDTTSGDPGIIYDDRTLSMRTIWTLVRHEGLWKWSEERIIERRWKAGLCDEF